MKLQGLLVAITVAVTATLAAPAAQARGGGSGYYLGVHLLPSNASEKIEAGTSGLTDVEVSANSMTLEALLGFNFGRLYVGGIYHSRTTSLEPGDDPKLTATGASLGVFYGGLVVMGHYFFQATSESGDAAGSGWSAGSGVGADVGFMFPLSSNFVMGANIAYRSLSFKKYDDGTTEYDDAVDTKTETAPRLTVGFIF